jgi:hypothetical protein
LRVAALVCTGAALAAGADCIVINAQNTREFYGCAEGLSVTFVNRQKMKL